MYDEEACSKALHESAIKAVTVFLWEQKFSKKHKTRQPETKEKIPKFYLQDW